MKKDYSWNSPLKTLEYHMPATTNAAEEELFNAVISGKVRSRYKGLVFGPEWLKLLAKFKPDPTNPFALPPNIEISAVDAERAFPETQRYELANASLSQQRED